LKIAENGHVRPAHRQMQALGEIRPPRVAKRARSCLLRQWLLSLRLSGAMSRVCARAHTHAHAHIHTHTHIHTIYN